MITPKLKELSKSIMAKARRFRERVENLSRQQAECQKELKSIEADYGVSLDGLVPEIVTKPCTIESAPPAKPLATPRRLGARTFDRVMQKAIEAMPLEGWCTGEVRQYIVTNGLLTTDQAGSVKVSNYLNRLRKSGVLKGVVEDRMGPKVFRFFAVPHESRTSTVFPSRASAKRSGRQARGGQLGEFSLATLRAITHLPEQSLKVSRAIRSRLEMDQFDFSGYAPRAEVSKKLFELRKRGLIKTVGGSGKPQDPYRYELTKAGRGVVARMSRENGKEKADGSK